MNIKEQAEIFAILAHDGQVRKADKEKPYVIHPLDVAKKLESYGYSDEVVAAGYLHDVVEDTPVTLPEIEAQFGSHIASLVKGATEENKTLSWENRKSATIERIKNLDEEHKAILCLDKISNLEDLAILFGKNGQIDFSSFKRGIDQQKWYYTQLYESLTLNSSQQHPMFQELKSLIDLVFNENSFQTNHQATLRYRHKELHKLKTLITDPNNYQTIYCKQLSPEVYFQLQEYLNQVGITAKPLTGLDTLEADYDEIHPFCQYRLTDHDLFVCNHFYPQIFKTNYFIPDPTAGQIAGQLANSILEDLIQVRLEEFNQDLKRKVRTLK